MIFRNMEFYEIDNKKDFDRIVNEHQISFIFIYAKWCVPCQEFKPKLEEYIKTVNYPNSKICFLQMDYDVIKPQTELFNIFQTTNLPTFYSYHLGKIDKPIISVDLIFIKPFLEYKMNDIERINRMGMNITDNF